MVKAVPLSASGPALSQLAFGTWRIFDEPSPPSPADLLRRIEASVELGITTIDTAEIYGDYAVEERLGAALTLAPGLRQRLQIVSKLGIYVPHPRHPDREVAFYDASAERIARSVDKSLRLLGIEALDLLLVHRPDWLTAAEDTAAGLEAVVRQGKVRHVGVSNYSVHQVELLQARLAIPLVTNQIELSLFEMGGLFDGTLDQCQRLRMRPMAWSPLGGGRLFNGRDEVAQRVRAAMEKLAPRYGDATAGELGLAWVLAHPSGPVAVFGTSDLGRLRTLARAVELRLTRHDWYLLWEAAQGRSIP
jgi:predicted oxidoreductase